VRRPFLRSTISVETDKDAAADIDLWVKALGLLQDHAWLQPKLGRKIRPKIPDGAKQH